jgi:hypothetical protein
MKKTTLLKTFTILCMLVATTGLLNAQLTAVTSSGLPNIGRGQIKFADFNNDGKLDALVVGQTTAYSTVGGKFGLYLGNGDGTFTDATATWFATTPAAVNCGMVSIADFDKDGYLDFCYAGRTDAGVNVIYLYKNSGSSFTDYTTTAFTGTTAPTGIYSGSIQWGDIDNDGDLDLMICGRTYNSLGYPTSSGGRGGVLQIYKNNNNGTFTQSLSNSTIGVCYGQALFVDLDNDGDLDIYYSGGGNVGGYIINDGTGTYGSLVSNNTTRASNMVIGDFNKDGIPDLLQSYTNTSGTPAPAFRMLYNTSAGTTITLTSTGQTATYGIGGTTATTNMGMLSCIDYNSDGGLDYTIQGLASATTPTTSLFLNSGTTGTATFTDSGLTLTGLNYGGAEWADLNGDNKPDLITFGYTDAAATTAATIVYLNGTTTANIAPVAPSSITAVTSSVAALSWTMPDLADDHTPNVSLTYNVRIGTSAGASNIMKASVYGSGKYNLPSATVKGLADGKYYWSVQAIDAANVAGAWATEGTFTIGNPTTTPTVQGTSVTYTSTTPTTLNLGWTNGDGYKTVVFMKAGNNTSDLSAPVNNTIYTANTAFGSGTQIGTSGWYCVFNGAVTPLATGTGTVTVSGLNGYSQYQVMAVSYNSSGDNTVINYLASSGTNNPAIATSSDYSAPSIITSALTVTTNTAGTSVVITPSQTGTGYNVPYPTVVFMKQGSDATEDVTLTSNTTYVGNTVFGTGTQIGTSGWYCVYNGNSSYLGSGNFNPFSAFTGLQFNTAYEVRACTYNGTVGLEKFSATSGVVFTTPVDPATGLGKTFNSIIVYPTITRGDVHVNAQSILAIEVVNLLGQSVKHTNTTAANNTINLSDLSTGTYFIKVHLTDGSVKVQRVIYQK